MNPNKDEPSEGEFHNAAVNPLFTPEQSAELEGLTGDLVSEIQAIFARVKAEVEAERADSE